MSRRIASLLASVLLLSCASYSGSGLKPGQSSLDDVLHVMGQPAMRWAEPDGAMQLSYPRGPYGFHSFMVYVDAEGHLLRIENVMKEAAFDKIVPGMKPDQVMRQLGPSEPRWTAYYKARDELVWEWRYCDAWSQAARFDVMFDNTSGLVRTSKSRREECGKMSCFCSR